MGDSWGAKVVFFVLFGHWKSHFSVPENVHFQQKCLLLIAHKWDFWCLNHLVDTTFARQLYQKMMYLSVVLSI